jgi:hypothetical protein
MAVPFVALAKNGGVYRAQSEPNTVQIAKV